MSKFAREFASAWAIPSKADAGLRTWLICAGVAVAVAVVVVVGLAALSVHLRAEGLGHFGGHPYGDFLHITRVQCVPRTPLLDIITEMQFQEL